MTGFATGLGKTRFVRVDSDVVAAGTTIDLQDLPISAWTHCFLTVTFYSDLAGTTVYQPTGSETGTVAMQVRTEGSQYYESPPLDTIRASAPETLGWSGNTVACKVTPSSLDAGILAWRVTIIANRT